MVQGLSLVYTGDGKGKTTAALGLALRQAGQGGRVLFLQFLKAATDGGEHKAVSHIPEIEIEPCGRPGFIIGEPKSEDFQLAARGIRLAKEALASGSYEMLVLDEINVAISMGLVSQAQVLDLLRSRGTVHLVLTGRGALPDIISAADIVSEIIDRKHDFQLGRAALAGIEY